LFADNGNALRGAGTEERERKRHVVENYFAQR
jgi:hypothetical protein